MGGKGKKKSRAPDDYRRRFYRNAVASQQLLSFSVQVRETDLQILASKMLEQEARHLVIQYRHHLESYIAEHPAFLHSLTPLPVDYKAPAIVKNMQDASQQAGVGPMAAVAGAIAEFVGCGLLKLGAGEIIVENGGDIYIQRRCCCKIAIFAGSSPLSGRLAVNLRPDQMPIGICTSSGTVGHSLSLGKADSVTVIAPSTGLADALATAIGNEIKTEADLHRMIERSKDIPNLTGVILIRGDKMAAWGDIELAALPKGLLQEAGK
ncbi:MAG: UPF0280 family protein [Deltaproteobacteria bacterium]